MIARNRLLCLAFAAVLPILGLASRRYADHLPWFVAQYVGDTLWALLAFVCLGFAFPRLSGYRVAGTALAIAYSVEISQLYHAPWIDNVRRTRLGGWVLGFGFLWSDFLCYTAGVALGLMLDRTLLTTGRRTRMSKSMIDS